MTRPVRLTAVLNHGDSLAQWQTAGLLKVQSALLREFQKLGMEITLVSFGGREELELASQLPGMKILCNRYGLPAKFYARRLHQLHTRQLIKSDLVQTIDAAGIAVALRIAWAWQIPLVYRFGFVLSWTRRRTLPDDTVIINKLENAERRGVYMAAHVMAPTHNIAREMARLAPGAADKITVMPNFVDTERFKPLPLEKKFDLVYVGRTSLVKNLWALLEAVEKLDVSLALVGGPLPRELGTRYDQMAPLKARFGDLDGRLHWFGRVQQEELPRYINQARAFILCSFSEGNARSMLEAMACGMPVIGTRVPELKYMLEHEVSGYLCETDAGSIEAAIRAVLSQPKLMQKMGANARRIALEEHSLSQLARREYTLLVELARRHPSEAAAARFAKYLLRRRRLPPLPEAQPNS